MGGATGFSGAADLHAATSTNQKLAAQWYNRERSLLSVLLADSCVQSSISLWVVWRLEAVVVG